MQKQKPANPAQQTQRLHTFPLLIVDADQGQSSEEEDEDSSSSSDSCESCSEQSSDAESSSTPASESGLGEAEPPDGQIINTLQHAGKAHTAGDSSIQPAAADGAGSRADTPHHNGNSPSNAPLLRKGQQQQDWVEGQWVIAAHSSTHHSCTQQDIGPTAAGGGMQLAAGSCSLSRSQRADLRRQLAAGLEEHKTAAALEKALADDPLLSLSLG